MNFRKITFSLIIWSVAIATVFALWKSIFLLSSALVVLALLKHKVYPLKRELVWFIIIGILGSSAESIVIFSGAWSYAQAQLINVPIWLPLLWGLAGTIGVTLYQGINEPAPPK